MTMQVTVSNPVSNMAAAEVHFQGPTDTCPTVYLVASGETKSFAIHGQYTLFIKEVAWSALSEKA